MLHLTDDQLLRFGAGIAISRPPLDALVTGFTLNPTGTPPTGGGGNPLLEPYKANQFDLSYEWYFHEESLFAVALYYKDLKTMIGASQSTQTIDGVQYIITSEEQHGRRRHQGRWSSRTRRASTSCRASCSDFGIYANYAYVDSNVHEVRAGVGSVHDGGPGASTPRSSTCSTTRADSKRASRGSTTARSRWRPPGWPRHSRSSAPEDILDASISYSWDDRYSDAPAGSQPDRRARPAARATI